MRKIIYIFIIIIILAIIGATLSYLSYIRIEKNQSLYIKTLFRPYTIYKEGHHIFPEKLLFFNPDAFIMHKITKAHKKAAIPINIALPKISTLKDETIYKIKYNLDIEYAFTKQYQMELLKNKNMKNEHTVFIEYLKNIDKQIVFSQIEKVINEQENNTNITTILENTNNTLPNKITDKYNKEKLILKHITHSYDSADNLQLYKEKLIIAKKLQKELNEKKSLYIKEDEENKIIWENKYNYARREIKMLEMYGKLFKEYPETLHYLYIEKLKKMPDKLKKIIETDNNNTTQEKEIKNEENKNEDGESEDNKKEINKTKENNKTNTLKKNTL